MKLLKIETNLAFEYVYNLMGIAYFEKGKQEDDMRNTRFHHFISDFIDDVHTQLPNIIKNDLRLFIKDFSCMYITLLHIIIKEQFTTPDELIGYFQGLSTAQLLNLYLEGNETGLSLDSSRESLEQTLDELSLVMHQDAKDKELFFEFQRYPQDVIPRLTKSFIFYYEVFFRPAEEKLLSNLKALQIRHQALYDDNPEAFINAILFQSKESLKDAQTEIHIYLGYHFGDRISVAYGSEHKVYFFYGAAAEKKLYSENLKSQYEELIKSLADDTRRNLIRFLMHAPHYNKEISDYLGITTATISYHIGRLVELGIIALKYQEGKRIYYQVDTERFNQLFDGLKRYLASSPL